MSPWAGTGASSFRRGRGYPSRGWRGRRGDRAAGSSSGASSLSPLLGLRRDSRRRWDGAKVHSGEPSLALIRNSPNPITRPTRCTWLPAKNFDFGAVHENGDGLGTTGIGNGNGSANGCALHQHAASHGEDATLPESPCGGEAMPDLKNVVERAIRPPETLLPLRRAGCRLGRPAQSSPLSRLRARWTPRPPAHPRLRPRGSARSSTPPPPCAHFWPSSWATDCAKQALDGLLHLLPNHVADHSDQTRSSRHASPPGSSGKSISQSPAGRPGLAPSCPGAPGPLAGCGSGLTG